jgi:aryl-alcohol dehydrogenase-like predicted oxidoreductase
LGTAQFGMSYGISNVSGKVGPEHVRSMLSIARRAGVDTLDTAVVYGDAEAVIGRLGVRDFRIVTKVPALRGRGGDVRGWMASQVEQSLVRLGVDRLEAVLLHDADDLAGPDGERVAGALVAMVERGLANKVGVSFYRPAQLAAAASRMHLDMVQGPLNVFDRRLPDSGWLERLAAGGTEVHIRSVFLQGLLLMPVEGVPEYLRPWLGVLRSWSDWSARHGTTPAAACLAHVLSYAQVSRVVVGCETPEQFSEILVLAAAGGMPAPSDFSSTDEDLIEPSRWRVS